MDKSLQGIGSEPGKLVEPFTEDEEMSLDEVESHIHLPNPSLWPFVLTIAIVATTLALLFVSTVPWLFVIPAIFVLIGIIGLAIEDPMAYREAQYIFVPVPVEAPSRFKIGQQVVDKEGKWLGKVQARFNRYLLVERGSFLPKVFYVPIKAMKDEIKNNTIFMTLSEEDLQRMELNRVPDDLYGAMPEYGMPNVSGVAQFGRGPLSPAQTGHYNYGRRSPGINTDASGSYHRNEVTPTPQRYVNEEVFATDLPIPSSVVSSD